MFHRIVKRVREMLDWHKDNKEYIDMLVKQGIIEEEIESDETLHTIPSKNKR